MLKRILAPIAVLILLITACKKDSSPTPVTPVVTGKNLDFKASASVPISVSLLVIRPTGLTTGVVGGVTESDWVNNSNAPYEYKSAKIQPGDQVGITVQTPASQTVTGTLTIDGVTIPYTSLQAGAALTILNWNIIVK
jgi:hypothetical protein